MADDLSRLRAFDDVTARVWRDKRCTPGTRELLLAVAWVVTRDAGYRDTGLGREHGRYLWQRVRDMLGHDRGRPRYKQLLADDAPCYRPPNTWPDRACEAPRIRAYKPRLTGSGIVSPTCLIGLHPHLGECRYEVVHSGAGTPVQPVPEAPSMMCGATPSPNLHLVERDPRNGWHVDRWFCARHRDHYDRVKAQLANAPEAPEPVPNSGGLLPCYFKADWERLYTQVRPHWKPPVYGIAADDWPGAISGGLSPRRPGLRLILGELADA